MKVGECRRNVTMSCYLNSDLRGEVGVVFKMSVQGAICHIWINKAEMRTITTVAEHREEDGLSCRRDKCN